jgi:hypothetical protein
LAAIAAVELFLQRVLVDGAVAVDALEVMARAAGLLGQHQQIGASKAFRRAKKGLRIRSVRAGFGRDGRWSWALPTASETASADHPPEVPTSVAYAENHSRPVQSGNGKPDDGPRRRHLPARAGVPAHRWCTFLSGRRPVHPVALGRTSGRPRLGRREPVWMSSRAPPRSPTGRRSALAHLRQQDRRHGRRLGDDRDRGAAHHP